MINSIAKYFLPSAEDMSRRVDENGQYVSGGIHPEIEVKLNDNIQVTLGDVKTDSQLQRAIQYILTGQ